MSAKKPSWKEEKEEVKRERKPALVSLISGLPRRRRVQGSQKSFSFPHFLPFSSSSFLSGDFYQAKRGESRGRVDFFLRKYFRDGCKFGRGKILKRERSGEKNWVSPSF